MSSVFLEFVASIRALGIENPIDGEHFYIWQINNQNKQLLPLIASLSRAQAFVTILFGSSPDVLQRSSRIFLRDDQ